jgi:hypothetical protein
MQGIPQLHSQGIECGIVRNLHLLLLQSHDACVQYAKNGHTA